MGTLWRKYVVINSWFLEDFESVAMWKTYLKSDEGIAIQTTFKDFTDSLIVHTEDDIQVGVVKYTDYETEAIPEDNIFAHFLHKRKSFGHEKEIRALISRFPIVSNKIDFNKEMFDDGLYVKVDLNRLIKKIYVSPYSKIWFYELTKSITKKYGFSFEVKDSCLKQKPVF